MRMTIRGRLLAVVGLSLLPIALLAYLFVEQSNKDIDFGSKELVGTSYFAALQADLSSLTAGVALPPSVAFDAARASFDDQLGTAELAGTYAAARAKASPPGSSIE